MHWCIRKKKAIIKHHQPPWCFFHDLPPWITKPMNIINHHQPSSTPLIKTPKIGFITMDFWGKATATADRVVSDPQTTLRRPFWAVKSP